MNAKKKSIFVSSSGCCTLQLNVPFSKFFSVIYPNFDGSSAILGAGVGVLILMIIRGAVGGGKTETHIAKSDFPYVME